MFNNNQYKVLQQQTYKLGVYEVVPIRYEDQDLIMKWRNEQMYHLRQNKRLTKQDQQHYFDTILKKLFDLDKPEQIIFSYLKGGQCIGYGGLVHINWIDKHAEVSFLMNTSEEEASFSVHWSNFLLIMQEVAFFNLNMHKIFTYAFDLRPHLYEVLEKNNFFKDAVLKQHCLFDGNFLDVVIHSKINPYLDIRAATILDSELTYKWAVDKNVRRYAFNRNPITQEEHNRWFISKIENRNCYYYIFTIHNQPVGSVRFDISGDIGFISYLLDIAFHGKGYGKLIILRGINQLMKQKVELNCIIGEVMSSNIASLKTFQKLGFQLIEESESKSVFKKNI